VSWTLASNPALAAIRQQRGIAAAGVVIARTYPYNPVLQAQAFGLTATTPDVRATILNPVQYNPQIMLALEVRGQRSIRKQAASAALTRTEWEIAFQEVTFAVNAVRAFDTLLYRQGKLQVTEEFLRLDQKAAEQVKRLVDGGQLRPADLILTRAEVADIQSQLGLGRTALAAAQKDLVRALGLPEMRDVKVDGVLNRPVPNASVDELMEAALELRPDLFAGRAAVAEAEAKVRLQIADRYGNPSFGPSFEEDPGKLLYIGAQFNFPIPILNQKSGEILQLKAQLAQTQAKLRQTQVEIRQDVSAAQARLAQASAWVKNYQDETLPTLRTSLESMEKLFNLLGQKLAQVDLLRVLDVRRRLLRARDGYLDAQWTYSQALADLALAVGDPTLAMGVYQLPDPR
jgi:outer membrane protein TolC